MRRTMALLAVVALTSLPAVAMRTGASRVKGQIIRVEQQVRTANGADYTRLTVRTRQGEEMQLRVGTPGACEDCYRVGDRVRARLGGGSGEREVRRMKVRRGGEQFALSNCEGRMTRQGPGPRAGDGRERGVRQRDQGRAGRSADCAGPGGRGGAGGGRGGGG